ncbi:Sulfotransferase family-containing protein [Strongyloides ratti]|uniref:Sulfotransferase family-containing protein n=1 Tax=Strongyloides ratti TaxID=34506 RepID=A0A090LL62_STRRB|nr:Sulfotransferase family-containing protein [Strongyloides ratti]CEF68913.1 Sulfotransferase family-containing protein [Strongyloides ratti]
MQNCHLKIFADILLVFTILLLVFNYSYWKIAKYETHYITKPKGFFPLGNNGKYKSNYRIWNKPKVLLCSEFPNTLDFLDILLPDGVNKTHDEIFSESKFANLKNVLENNSNGTLWKLIIFIHNPMERFMKNFMDYCGMNSKYGTESTSFCFYCNGEINCFLTRLFDYLNEKCLMRERFIPTLRDKLFAPQFWKCNLKLDASYYNIIQVNDKNNFFDELTSILKNSNISIIDKSIEYQKAKEMSLLLHNKENKTILDFYENILTKNDYLLTKFITIYFFDYYTFSYEIPYF